MNNGAWLQWLTFLVVICAIVTGVNTWKLHKANEELEFLKGKAAEWRVTISELKDNDDAIEGRVNWLLKNSMVRREAYDVFFSDPRLLDIVNSSWAYRSKGIHLVNPYADETPERLSFYFTYDKERRRR